ncbi:MAG: gamma carbonic anhydrase family protein [Candidatus Heteroscillospira sp.]|jgi:carbonic anhydrase/acetyltransferase-like protein (isoleucine patch superfamily)
MKKPNIHPSARVAPGAVIVGDVTLEENVNIWYNSVLRADYDSIHIGAGTNVQDGCVLHISRDCPVNIGMNVTIGHGAIVHGCTVGDNCLIGMGSIVMDRAVIGKNCIVAAGAVVVGGTVVPDNSLVMGSPAKVKRQTRPEEWENNLRTAKHYVETAAEQF